MDRRIDNILSGWFLFLALVTLGFAGEAEERGVVHPFVEPVVVQQAEE